MFFKKLSHKSVTIINSARISSTSRLVSKTQYDSKKKTFKRRLKNVYKTNGLVKKTNLLKINTVKPVQTTTFLRWPLIYDNKCWVRASKFLLYKTCLTRLATTFFCLPNEKKQKKLSKTTTTKLYPAKEWETNVRQQSTILYLLYYNAKSV